MNLKIWLRAWVGRTHEGRWFLLSKNNTHNDFARRSSESSRRRLSPKILSPGYTKLFNHGALLCSSSMLLHHGDGDICQTHDNMQLDKVQNGCASVVTFHRSPDMDLEKQNTPLAYFPQLLSRSESDLESRSLSSALSRFLGGLSHKKRD